MISTFDRVIILMSGSVGSVKEPKEIFAVKQEVQTLFSRFGGKQGVASCTETFILKPAACSLPVCADCSIKTIFYYFMDCIIMAQQVCPKKLILQYTRNDWKMPRCIKMKTYCSSKYST